MLNDDGISLGPNNDNTEDDLELDDILELELETSRVSRLDT